MFRRDFFPGLVGLIFGGFLGKRSGPQYPKKDLVMSSTSEQAERVLQSLDRIADSLAALEGIQARAWMPSSETYCDVRPKLIASVRGLPESSGIPLNVTA